MTMKNKIKIGISTCLLGERVRYDGGHKHDRYVTGTLGGYFEYVPVCPEFELGLGVPRESLRLVGDPASPRLMTTRTKVDITAKMKQWARKRLCGLEREDLCGYIFKSKSPSSGMMRVKVYNESGMPSGTGSGIFAKAFMDHFPTLPVEEDGRMHDPVLRENFIERVFAMKRWRELISGGRTRGRIVRFHSENKLQIMAHSPVHLRDMGRLVASPKGVPAADLYGQYRSSFVEALRLRATPAKNTNVLQHIMGYFKKQLTPDEKQELLEVIHSYRKGLVPLVVPVTLINHYVRKFRPDYLMNQTYLQPHPTELALRNHV
jgi:uncharacterized protein YbgA (DUF1722 family)/uncharacterized protein YbbK (DUF523 family)